MAVFAILTGVAGNFAYDRLKGDGAAPPSPLPATDSRGPTPEQRPQTARPPKRIDQDPTSVVFFDPVSGKPLVWYHKNAQGPYELFDGPGFYLGSGSELLAITPAIVDQIHAQVRAEKTKAAESQRNDIEIQKRSALARLFGTDTYPDGATLIGVRPQNTSPSSMEAARSLTAGLLNVLSDRATIAEVPQALYQSDAFDQLIKGSLQDLRDSGLGRKLRAAVFATTKAACRPTTSVVGKVTCDIDVKLRGLDASLKTIVFEDWTANGAGTDDREALARAVERLFEQNSKRLKTL